MRLMPPLRPAKIGVLIVAGLSVTSCQTDNKGSAPPALSLEQAKKVSVAFEKQAFVPPPRTIGDITAVLDSQKRDYPERNNALIARANAQEPQGGRLPDRIRFYSSRGWAAFKIGRTAQAIADLKQANRLAERARRMKANARAELLNRLSQARYAGGLPQDAMADLKQAIEVNANPGKGAAMRSRLAIWLTLSGDLDGADRTIRNAEIQISVANQAGGPKAEIWMRNERMVSAAVKRAAARILMARGDYDRAEATLRESLASMATYQREAAEDDAKPHLRLSQYIHADLGLALLHQGRRLEAEVEIRSALDGAIKLSGRYSPDVARFAANLASVMAAEGRAKDAEKLARASLEIMQAVGSEDGSRFLSLARIMLGKSLAAQSRWKEADAVFEPMLAAKTPDYAFALRGVGPLYGIGLLQTGDPARAAAHAREAIAFLEPRFGRKHRATAAVIAVLAAAQTATGDRRGALSNFAESIPILLSRSRAVEDETGGSANRAYWLDILLESYIRLLSDIYSVPAAPPPGLNPIETAFTIAESARGQRVQGALAASAARASVGDPALSDLVRREQDAVKRIGALNALYASAVSVPEEQRNASAIEDLRRRIDVLRGARAALAEEIERRAPNFAQLVAPKPVSIDAVRKALRPGEALIATFVGKNDSYVWAVSRDRPVRFARIALPASRLDAAVRELRSAMSPRGTTLNSIPRFDVALSHRLYRALLAPVADGWKDEKSLMVVAHGPLGQLPFSLLVTDAAGQPTDTAKSGLFSSYRTVPWLIRTHAITVLPSVGSLATLRSAPAPEAGRRPFVGFGDPVFDPAATPPAEGESVVAMRGVSGLRLRLRASPKAAAGAHVTLKDLPRLPDTAVEVESIAKALGADPAKDVFIGRAASEQEVHTVQLNRYRVVAFATHGLVPGDLDGLTQPALALSAPPPGDKVDDGLLTLSEILGLKMDADWVVLSACNTAAADGKGVEAVSGLGRAFFYAGTRAILASNWPVESTSARMLTTDLFERQAHTAGLGRAEALREAIVAMIDKGTAKDASGRTVFTYAHPIFWAPFSLYGDGGGTPGT